MDLTEEQISNQAEGRALPGYLLHFPGETALIVPQNDGLMDKLGFDAHLGSEGSVIALYQNQPKKFKNKLFWLIFNIIFGQTNPFSYLCG